MNKIIKYCAVSARDNVIASDVYFLVSVASPVHYSDFRVELTRLTGSMEQVLESLLQNTYNNADTVPDTGCDEHDKSEILVTKAR